MRKQSEEKSRLGKSVKAKRAYETPRLIEFGSVAKLTAGSGTNPPNDSGESGPGMAMMGTCL
jgi:hypothetical protein